ncbi:MAG: AMP-binding enzyme, partial [Roseiarcus sp.]
AGISSALLACFYSAKPARNLSAVDKEILLGIPGVADCAVFGIPDEFWGERVAALIVRGTGQVEPLSAESVEAFCRRRLAGFKTPKTILFSDEPLPRTPTGKVQKFVLVERYHSRP